MERLTMADVKAMNCDFISPSVAAGVLKMDTGRLIQYAREGQLPFPVQISGNRVKISRQGFLKTYGYADPEEEKPTTEQLLAKLIDKMDEIEALIERMGVSV